MKVDEVKTQKVGSKVEDQLVVVDADDNSRFAVTGTDIISAMKDGSTFETVEKKTMTELAQMLSTSYNTPFTVTFTKATGETRVLRGRLVEPETLLGRSWVEDLDIDAKHNRLRQVDHRTITSLIINGVKYEEK